MTDHIDKTIGELQSKLKEQEEAVIMTKRLINSLCEHSDKPIMFTDTELSANSKQYSFAPDEFYGQPLTTAMRKILEVRKATNLGPAAPKQIYAALIDGGYAFDSASETNRLTNVRLSLRKGSSVFHRLPNKLYGLLAWYPKAKKSKPSQDSDIEDIEYIETNEEDTEEI